MPDHIPEEREVSADLYYMKTWLEATRDGLGNENLGFAQREAISMACDLVARLEAVEKDKQLHTDIYVAKLHSSESVKRVADALLSLLSIKE